MDRIPDYEDLRLEYEAEQERLALRNRKKVCGEKAVYPKCNTCNEKITDEHLYDIDGDICCRACWDHNYLKRTENYIRMEKIYG